MQERAVLEIRHHSKSYRRGKKAVDDVSLVVMPGDIFGFIGHNGAGKSTTICAVVGVLDFTEGISESTVIPLRTSPSPASR